MNLVFASGYLFPQTLFGIHYFSGLEDRYKGQHRVSFPRVSPLATSAERAGELAAGIQADIPQGDLHIIAHSMGGLDSRTLIGNNIGGLTGRIKSLTTLSTPHKGSPVADFILGPRPIGPPQDLYDKLRSILERLNIKIGALGDLTEGGAAQIPNVIVSHSQIRYRSYFGGGRSGLLPTSVALKATHDLVKAAVPNQPNDGLVALESAKYGDFQQTFWSGDHADIVGHNLNDLIFGTRAFDHFPGYDKLIAQL